MLTADGCMKYDWGFMSLIGPQKLNLNIFLLMHNIARSNAEHCRVHVGAEKCNSLF